MRLSVVARIRNYKTGFTVVVSMKYWALWLLFAVAVFLSVVLLVPDLRRAMVPSGAVALTCAVIVAWIFVLTGAIEPIVKCVSSRKRRE